MEEKGIAEKLKIAEERVKMSRIWIFALGFIQLGIGIYQFLAVPDKLLASIGLLADGGLGIVFIALAWWSFRKPTFSFLSALVIYLALQAIVGYFNPAYLFTGVIIKAIILLLLVKAYTNARALTKLRTGEM